MLWGGRHEGNARDKSMRRGFLAGWFRFPKVNPRARGNPAEFNAQKSSNGENSDVLYMHEISKMLLRKIDRTKNHLGLVEK